MPRSTFRLAGWALPLLCLTTTARAEAPRLVVQPSAIELHGRADRHRILVTAIAADGRTADVTATATFASSRPAVLAGSGTGAAPPDRAPRRAPVVLVPEESAVAVARVQLRSLVFDFEGRRLSVLALERKLEKGRDPMRKWPPRAPPEKKDMKAKWVELTKVKESDQLARQPQPARMAILAASFPYKAQLDEHRRSLGLANTAEVLREEALRFEEVRVERRELGRDRKAPGKWRALPIKEDYRPYLLVTGRALEPEAPGLEALMFPGLAMPRPKLFQGAYPAVEQRLPCLQKALKALPKAGVAAEEKPPTHCLLRIVDVSVHPDRTYQYRLRVCMTNPNVGRKDVAPALARDKQLLSAWYVVPQPAVVGPEVLYYAVDRREAVAPRKGPRPKDLVKPAQVVLQAHRWLDTIVTNTGAELYLGDWSVAERLAVYRGEYVGRKVIIELPYWRYVREEFLMAVEAVRGEERKRPQGIGVDFGYGRVGTPQPEAILVDFTPGQGHAHWRGGRRPAVEDASAVETLILSPDGQLLAQNSARDARDPERIQRLEAYRKRIRDVRAGQAKPGG